MFVKILLALLILLPGIYIVLPWGIRNVLRKRFIQKAGDQSGLYITFDDGPDPRSTPRILEILKNHNAKATFFTVGTRMDEYPDLVSKIVSEGHDIGFHSNSHLHPWFTGPVGSFRDLFKTPDPLSNLSSPDITKLFRPPFGKLNLATLIYLWWKGSKLVFWTLDPKDYLKSSSDEVIHRVLEGMSDGTVVLLHDGRRGEKSSPVEVTVSALEKILEGAKQAGLVLKKISEGFGDRKT